MSKPNIGKILDPDLKPVRDAIHIPILPAYAIMEMERGTPVVVTKDATTGQLWAEPAFMSKAIGVVDPYLEDVDRVEHGDYFYVHLKPETVRKLWHEWTHNAID